MVTIKNNTQRGYHIENTTHRAVPILRIYNTHGGDHIENMTHRKVTRKYNTQGGYRKIQHTCRLLEKTTNREVTRENNTQG